MRRSELAVLCMLAVATMPTVAVAQATSDTAARCFTGRPLPRCTTFWLTEAGYYWRVVSTGDVQRFESGTFDVTHLDSHVSWEVGRMSNRSPRTAAGGTILIGVDDTGMRFGLKGRYRKWLGEQGILDVSAGALRAAIHLPYPQVSAPGYGITGDVTLGWKDWAALTLRGDVLRSQSRTAGAVYGGVRLGSYAAIVATAAGAAYIALMVAALSGGDY